MSILKNFVVFEGGDGSGTTTQMKKLKEKFSAESGLPALFGTYEPTDGPVGRLIRQGLKGKIPFKNETVACLFAADRNDHIYGPLGIAERCGRGELVVCDRYVLSSLVYQGITCGEELPEILNRQFPMPELTIFFDIDPETAQKRIENRRQKEIYEAADFQVKVCERYRTLLPRFKTAGSKTVIIDACKPVDEVAGEVWRAIKKLPIFKG